MALSFAHGAIRWLAADAVNTTYPVTGLSFQPKALRFYWVGLDSAGTDVNSEAVSSRRGVGFATSTSNRRSVASMSVDNDASGNSNCGTVAADDCVVCTTDAAGGRDGELDLSAIASDGFTLIVDDQGVADITVFWEAWGGTDITNALCGDIAEPAATGDQNYTATGFTAGGNDQVVMFAGVQSVAAVNTAEAEASGLCVGFSSGTATDQNIVVYGNADDASANADTDGRCFTGEVICQCAKAGAATVTARATLTAYGVDLFTLNWSAVNVTSRRNIYLAIKGGAWEAGAYTIEGQTGSATATVTNKRVNPIGLCLIGRMTAIQTTNATTAEDRLGFGTASSTSSRRSMGMWDEHGTGVGEINTTIQYDQVLSFPSNAGGLASAYDLNSLSSTGFQIIVDTAGGVTGEWQGYLAFGSHYGASSSDTLPFLVETASTVPSVTASDAMTAGLTESAAITAIYLSTSDSLTAGLTEATAVTVPISTSDAIAGLVSDPDITAFELTGLSDPTSGFTDTVSSLDTGGIVPKAGSDTMPGLAEAVILLATVSTSDTLTAGLTETAAAAVTLAVSDAITAGLVDTANTLAVALATADALMTGMDEAATLAVTLDTSDTLIAGLVDGATPAVTLTTADTLTIGLDDLAALSIVVDASDSLRVYVDDPDITAFELTGLTDLFPAFIESAQKVDLGATDYTGSEALAIGPAESAMLSVTVATSDALAASLTEGTTIATVLTSADTLTAGLTDAATVAGLLTATEALQAGHVETAALAVTLTSAESDAAGLIEAATLYATLATTDTMAAGLAESATALPMVATTDTLTAGLTEGLTARGLLAVTDSLPQFVEGSSKDDGTLATKTASDALRVGVDDLDIRDIYLNGPSDPAHLGLDEAYRLVGDAILKTGSDPLTQGLTETAATIPVTVATSDTVAIGIVEPYVFEQQPASSDSARIGVTESTALVDLLGGITSITDDDLVLAVGLTEAATVRGLLALSDTLTGLTEQTTLESAGVIEKTASDAAAIHLYPDFPTTGTLDRFNRANEDPLNTQWNQVTSGIGQVRLVANQARGASTGGIGWSYWATEPFGPDMEVWATVAKRPEFEAAHGLFVRITNPYPASFSGYLVQFVRSLTANQLSVVFNSYTNAAQTVLQTHNDLRSWADGDEIGVSVRGSELVAWFRPSGGAWTALARCTTSTHAGAGYLGVGINDGQAVNAALDDVGGGTYAPMEQSALAASLNLDDALSGLVESTATLLSTQTDDVLSNLDEATNIIPIEPVTAADAINNIFNVILAENANIVDLTGGLSTHSDTEALLLALDENAIPLAFQPVSEDSALGLEETATLAVVIVSADTLLVQITGESGTGALILLQVDDLLASLAEDVTNALSSAVEDTVGNLLSDLYQRLEGQLAADETLALALLDSSTQQDITDLLTQAGAETIRLGITESAVIESVSLLGGQIIITTVSFLNRKTTILANGPLTADGNNMPKQAQLSEV